MKAENLINTSVDDASVTLKGMLARDPLQALSTIVDIYRQLDGLPGHGCLRNTCATVGRAAIKQLSGVKS